MKLLVIDNDPNFIRICDVIFQKQGHDVSHALSIRNARERLITNKEPFDVVFLDIYMQDEDGVLFLEELRQHEHLKQQKIVVFSGIQKRCDMLACQSLNAKFIAKEMDLPSLRRTLLKSLED